MGDATDREKAESLAAKDTRIAELETLIRDLPCVGCEAPGLECSNCRTRREAFE